MGDLSLRGRSEDDEAECEEGEERWSGGREEGTEEGHPVARHGAGEPGMGHAIILDASSLVLAGDPSHRG